MLFLCVLTIGTFFGAVCVIQNWNRSGHFVAPVRIGDVYHRPICHELVVAARNGDDRTVKLLLGRGISPDAVTGIRGKPTARVTAMEASVRAGHIRVLRLLLDYGADVNAPNTDGMTALWLAAVCGRAEVLKLLIQRGADVHVLAGRRYRISALSMASYGVRHARNDRERQDYEATVAALEQAGAHEWPPPWWYSSWWVYRWPF
jgi:hypothetical protein